jgi:hypothetical protein
LTVSVQESLYNFQTAYKKAARIKFSETTLNSALPGLKMIKIGQIETKWRLFKVKISTESNYFRSEKPV